MVLYLFFLYYLNYFTGFLLYFFGDMSFRQFRNLGQSFGPKCTSFSMRVLYLSGDWYSFWSYFVLFLHRKGHSCRFQLFALLPWRRHFLYISPQLFTFSRSCMIGSMLDGFPGSTSSQWHSSSVWSESLWLHFPHDGGLRQLSLISKFLTLEAP